MNRSTIIILLLLTVTFFSCAGKNIHVTDLRCDYETNPQTVEKLNPLLKWQLLSDERGQNQSAYRILVSTNLSALKEDSGDYWDSGKILSSQSIVKYQGKPLDSRVNLYWKVMIWDQNDVPSEWSGIASWTMGLLQPSDWHAKWIGKRADEFPDTALTFPAPYFRKEFSVGKKVRKAIAYVSGLGFYEMFLNGTKIGDQVLAPAVTNYDKRSLRKLLYQYDDQSTQRVFYNAFDVTEYLNEQKNAVGIVLGNGWYNQRDRTIEGNMWYDVPKLILQLEIAYMDGTNEIVASDGSWKTTTGPLLHDAIFTGEVYDARLELGAWKKASYVDDSWNTALEVRQPSGALTAQSIPFSKVQRTIDASFEQSNDSLYLITLPETVSGWCAINVEGAAGDSIKLRYISDEGFDYGQKDTYILKGGGAEEWEPRFTWHAFRQVEVVSKNVKLSKHNLTVKSIYTDIETTGNFESSNDLLNKINEAFVRTMHANFQGIISSDPHRERLAYTGDAQVIVGSLINTFDMTRLLPKMFDDIHDARNKNTGYVPHTAPFGGGGGGPAWGSAYIIMPWNYFCHYGDTTVLRDHYNGMKQWVKYLETRTDEHGLIVREEPNGWCLGEWSTPHNNIEIPPPFVNTAYYYHVTSIMAKVAGALEKKNDALDFTKRAEAIKANFNKAFYHKTAKHYWEGRQGADVLALAFGLVPDGDHKKVFASLLEHLERVNYHFDTGILATPLTLQVLSENGRTDVAYRLMNQKDFPSYGYLLDSKNSTLWETWGGDIDDLNGSGRCHPMFGSIVSWFYYSLAGIKPDELNPGMKHFYIEPTPVPGLNYCRASYDSLYGKISSDWKLDEDGNFHLKIDVPVNTTATVIFPQWEGAGLLESSVPITQAESIVMNHDHPHQLEVSSGTYNFILKK